PLITEFENAWSLVDGVDGRLWFVTNQGAPRYRIVSIDLEATDPAWDVIVPEREEPVDGAAMVGDRLIATYLKDASSLARVFDFAGNELAPIELAGIGTASGF